MSGLFGGGGRGKKQAKKALKQNEKQHKATMAASRRTEQRANLEATREQHKGERGISATRRANRTLFTPTLSTPVSIGLKSTVGG